MAGLDGSLPPLSRSSCLVAALFAVDPRGLGGVCLRAAAGPLRDAWLHLLRSLLPVDAPIRRVPLHIGDDALLGGLDLTATLQAGRPVFQRGVLCAAAGGVLVLAMAERMTTSTAGHVTAALDAHGLAAGNAETGGKGVGVVALDEGIADDERVPARLLDRLAFHLVPVAGGLVDESDAGGAARQFTREHVLDARRRLPEVRVDNGIIEAFCAAAQCLGVDSLRAPLLAVRAACAAAALDGRVEVDEHDAAMVARLVLAPRATLLPPNEQESDDGKTSPGDGDPAAAEVPPGADEAAADAIASRADEPAAEAVSPDAAAEPAVPDEQAVGGSPAARPSPGDSGNEHLPDSGIDDVVLKAALAAIPPGLLSALNERPDSPRKATTWGSAGALRNGGRRGRPSGVRRGEPGDKRRLNIIATLRAAAPWQASRRREAKAAPSGRILVRREDFQVTHYRQSSETTTVFVVDASGSAALHRLAETKGAVELLLADCYVRRDSVAVLAFRGRDAQLLLPPTRSLVRAKRSLAQLPGGGGTPLAAGIDAAALLAGTIRRRGCTPLIVLLTDGRANIARDGSPGRARACVDAIDAARRVRQEAFSALLLDTSPQAQEPARLLANAMGARYLPLPHAGAPLLSQAVRQVARQV